MPKYINLAIIANNGEAGVKLAETEIPDIIISDIMMPKMDGYQVTQALRQNPITDHIPIILLTARSDLDSRLKGWQEKADEYLTKPFDINELNLRLENLLSIRDILKKRFAENIFKPSKHIKETNHSEKVQSKNLEQETCFDTQQEAFLQKLNQMLNQLYQQSDTKVSHIAELMASSERQLSRKLKSILDLTPSEYLRRFRLEKAKQLLEQGEPVNCVTFEVGFSSQSYFSKCFKAQFDCSPSEFLNQ
ncbi:response regulator transcription factor [Aliikangiella sp. IMCC44359]|uniref:response regulator transcription factor n=1 Tax=Aliikangiella sp. IMCC44359 TaxID=3459125 RepID=UPI00403B37A4